LQGVIKSEQKEISNKNELFIPQMVTVRGLSEIQNVPPSWIFKNSNF